MVTIALNRGHMARKIFLLDAAADSIDTVWCRTPFQVLFVVHICPCEKFVISAR